MTAEVAYDNARMRSLLKASGRQLYTQIGYGSLHFRLQLEAAPSA
jgi:hypothetical protein